jgi:hypothetical protein
MAWEFSAECDACGHHWDDLMWNERVGHYNANAHRYFCAKCFVHVSIAPDLDRYTFPKWLAANDAAIQDSRLLQRIAALINDAMKDNRGLLIPHSAYSDSLCCPSCDRPLVAGSLDDNPIVCPNCASERARSTGVHSHVSLARVDDTDDQP